MSKRIAIFTGGTGGHVYPAMVLADQLKEHYPDSRVLFIGGNLTTNRYFDRDHLTYHSVSCGTVLQRSPQAIIQGAFRIGKGVWESWKALRSFHPHVVVSFGSFYSFPPLIASRLMGLPIILHEANSIPGKVTRMFSKSARVTGVHFPMTLKLLKGPTVEVGMPLRKSFSAAHKDKKKAKQHYGLSEDKPVILVFGGSQGARTLNHTIQQVLPSFCVQHDIQVIHLVGDPAVVESCRANYQQRGVAAYVAAYEKNMEIAWAAAELAVCRAGASTIAEQMAFEVPAIFVPYPFASDNHQELNADFVVNDVGGGVKLLESSLNKENLHAILDNLFHGTGDPLKQMSKSIQRYLCETRNISLYSLVEEVLKGETDVR